MSKLFVTITFWIFTTAILKAQVVYNFQSIIPSSQTDRLQLPADFTFQYLVETGQRISDGSHVLDKNDFAGYIPASNSSTVGTLVVNSEDTPGGVSIYDVQFDAGSNKWEVSNGSNIDFSPVNGTARNCSGGISPWGTFVSCEEKIEQDLNNDGFNDLGWAIEIDPITRTILDYPGGLSGADKIWGMGNLAHENVAFHPNQRTVYLGSDQSIGYIFKYVTNNPADLSAGSLYVYTGPKSGNGAWVYISCWPCANDPNLTNTYATNVGATVFDGVEDLEYDTATNSVFAAVKNESAVYRFTDDQPLLGGPVSNFHTYVGGVGQTYNVSHTGGVANVAWSKGNDNLAIDNAGNLWVLQDGGSHYIWVVKNGHTQANPQVSVFGIAPNGSEPTGITFTPDNKYMFLSIQHPNIGNISSSQMDACGQRRFFQNDVTIVLAHENNLGAPATCIPSTYFQNEYHTSGIYQVVNDIRSNSTVSSPIDVHYHAGTCILLENGFEVFQGAAFEAKITACNLTAR